MTDIETRLKETFETVAERTTVDSGATQLTPQRSRRLSGVGVAIGAFVLMAVVLAIPALLSSPPTVPAGNGEPPVVEAPVEPEEEWEIDEAWFNPGTYSVAIGYALRSDDVWCLTSSGPGRATGAEGTSLERSINVDDFIATCVNHPEINPEAPEAVTICRATFPLAVREGWRRSWSSSGHILLTAGTPGGGPGFPVVLNWDSDCVSEDLDTSPDKVTLSDDLDLVEINRVRQMEIALRRAAIANCFTYDQALELAREARDRLGSDWIVKVESPVASSDADCFTPYFSLQYGFVSVLSRL